MPYLYLLSDQNSRSFLLSDQFSIGRAPGNTLTVDDRTVSKNHCLLIETKWDRYLLRDLGSSNGTFVNGNRVSGDVLVADRDIISVGGTRLCFVDERLSLASLFEIREDSAEEQIHSRVDTGPGVERFLPVDRITDRDTLEADYEKLRLAQELQRDIASDMNLEILLPRILERISEFLDYDQGLILLADRDGKLVPRAARNKRVDDRVVISSTMVRLVQQERAGILSVDASADHRFKRAKSIIAQGIRSTIAAPILNRGQLLGMMIIGSSSRVHAFLEKDLQLITAIAGHTGQLIRNSLLHQELQELFKSAVGALAATVDARHPLTAGHSERVTRYALSIAGQLDLNRTERETLGYGALLHDVGKIGIPDSVLLKNGPLTEAERETMKTHPVKTRTILERFRFPETLKGVPHIAACHHEQVDGLGYPDGIRGEKIPRLARIISVADVFDALTSVRDYPKYDLNPEDHSTPMTPDRAAEIIKSAAGTRFDPDVVSAFVASVEAGEFGEPGH